MSSWARSFDLQLLSVWALEGREGKAGGREGVSDPVAPCMILPRPAWLQPRGARERESLDHPNTL